MLERILKLQFIPSSNDWGMLALRLGICGSLFLKHGYEKIFTFSQMAVNFPDPLHIGSTPSLICALIGDSVCSLLIVVGLATRLSALYSLSVILVAWGIVHHFIYFPHSADHGQVCWLYIAGLIPILIAGPGRFSIDFLLKD